MAETDLEFELRSFGIDLLALADKHGTGPITVYVDPVEPRYMYCWANERDSGDTLAEYCDFIEEDE